MRKKGGRKGEGSDATLMDQARNLDAAPLLGAMRNAASMDIPATRTFVLPVYEIGWPVLGMYLHGIGVMGWACWSA
jgi:hypothetical protein